MAVVRQWTARATYRGVGIEGGLAQTVSQWAKVLYLYEAGRHILSLSTLGEQHLKLNVVLQVF